MKQQLLWFLFAISSVRSSHFRGVFVSWIVDHANPSYYPSSQYSGYAKVQVRLGMSWRRSDSTGGYCNDYTIANRNKITTYSWTCRQSYRNGYTYTTSCSGLSGLSSYYCDHYNTVDDYTVGYNNFTWTPYIGYRYNQWKYVYSTSSCCWVNGMVSGSSSSWHVQVSMDFSMRPDNNSMVNSSPQVSYLPVYHVESGFQKTFSLPVWDPDGDVVKCRWAKNFTEGGGVYHYRYASLNEYCQFTIPSYLSLGWYPVAIMVEDYYYNGTGLSRLSSIPLQFTFKVNSSGSSHGVFKSCSVCQQSCANAGYYYEGNRYKTLYRCVCRSGFILNPNTVTCRANGTAATHSFTNISSIHQLGNQYVFDFSLCKGRYRYAGTTYPSQFSSRSLYICYCDPGYVLGQDGRSCRVNSSMSVIQPSKASYTTAVYHLGTPSIASPSIYSKAATEKHDSLDGCKYYQVLADPSRLVNYIDWNPYRCDKELYGWYRFMGPAGNRMANFCPIGVPGTYKCGSYYQGWLHGSQPRVYEGSVPRTVCFSRFYSCFCDYTTQAYVRNCGSFYVYWLNKVPVCNLRYCGLKDSTTTVSCSTTSMQVALDTNYFNYSLYSSITFRDSNCKVYLQNNVMYLTSSLTSCGTTKTETNNHIIYENEVQMVAAATSGNVITRNLNQNIRVSCSYGRTGLTGVVGFKPISTLNVSEPGFGNFTFNFKMYTSRSFTKVHYIYPVTVQLRDWLYFETSVSSGDKDVFIIIEKCYSTPSIQRNDPVKYTFIDNRCRSDPTVEFINNSTSNHNRRFTIQAFRFIGNFTAVYVHCEVFLCHRSSTDSRCHPRCNGNNVPKASRKKREVIDDGNNKNIPSVSKNYDLSNGPVKIDNDVPGKDAEAVSGPPIATIAMGVGITLLVIVVAGLAFKVTKIKSKAKVQPEAPQEDKYKQKGNKYMEMVEEDTNSVIAQDISGFAMKQEQI